MSQCGFLCVTPQHSHEKYFMTLSFSGVFWGGGVFCFDEILLFVFEIESHSAARDNLELCNPGSS